MTWIEWMLVGWSVAAISWWLMALALVCREGLATKVQGSTFDVRSSNDPLPTLTIFKPLPSIPVALSALQRALESFVSQLDGSCDMLIGVEEQDHAAWKPIFDDWRKKYPSAHFQVFSQPRPSHTPNPKISWQMELAAHATGKLWLWSDADIVAPPGFLRAIRAELDASGLKALTSPYVARAVVHSEGILDALFVNIEFYPGVLLLKKRGPAAFAFGAATLFHEDEFHRNADWLKLGSALADDFELGRSFARVAVGHATVETLPGQGSWEKSISHYLRWHKTIRWCQPLGYAGQIAILPVIGWLIFLLIHPSNPVGWLGWLVTSQAEVAAAILIFQQVDCRIPLRWWWVFEGWTLLRPMIWIASWLPVPVKWGDHPRKWRQPVLSSRNG